ncbi:EAL domain-containing protein [Pseudomonas akapageensis]|uniref:EAL domain-containing protein n=1 Tax=Pseudomonas akapageensis TaxID=2609961 RepID=UPI00140AB9A9|nr:EAL domain-containing protein [Pseudomonas akapageensis]
MPLTMKRSRRSAMRTLLPWLIGSLPVLLGLGTLQWQAQQDLKMHALRTAEQAVAQFDLMLDSVALSAQAILPLAGQSCDQVKLALREEVVRRPFLRTTNLLLNDNLYCSSIYGDDNRPDNAANYVDGKLWLMRGNPITPDHALLAYRLSDGNRAAVTTIDSLHLANALRMIGGQRQLVLQVGNAWLSADGQVHALPTPAFAVAATDLASARYNFSIHTGFATNESWRLMTQLYQPVFGLLTFLGIMAGTVCYWMLRRARSPRLELQRAIDANEFIPFFQPVVRGDDCTWAGAEALMRWQHPSEGLVRPDMFIPQAEHCGLIVPMTRSLMQQVAEQLAPHADVFPENFHLGINIAADHCQDPTLLDDCRRFLAAFPPDRITLVLELTERELIRPTETTQKLFEDLHGLGVLISIDDFGTGHSSLGYLREFKVDYLKIDRSFVSMIGVDALSLHILDSIIELSKKLELRMVAEGVENQVQRDYLAARKVDFLQGYLFARPMTIDEFIERLRQQPHLS